MVAALVGCSSGSQKNPTDAGGSGTGGAGAVGHPGTGGGQSGVGGAPSAATDTNPANPHVTNTPPSSPNGPPVTVQPGAGGVTGGGLPGPAGSAAQRDGRRAGQRDRRRDRQRDRAARPAVGVAGGVTGSGGSPGGTIADAGAPADASSSHDAAVTGTNGGIPATWATVDCVGGPCGPPGVCVNLDFLFVACATCGGEDQVCCPPYAASDPFLGTCGAGLICARNPNFHQDPPLDLVQDVCQVPGSPPPSDGGLNHERLQIAP